VQAAGPTAQAFQQAGHDFGVPANLLEALCYMEARFSMHNGTPSIDGGYGCNLTKNKRVDTLDQAARKLGVSPKLLQNDLNTNIRGVAYILSTDARTLSPSHSLPTSLAGWQGALEIYSNARSRATAHLYANEVYTLLKQGFSGTTDKGEVITVAPQTFSAQTNQPHILAAAANRATASDPATVNALPAGCSNDGKTDYPGVIDCILNPAQHDCDLVPGTNAPCNYFSSSHYGPTYRQNDGTITHIVIHDIEGTALGAINTFEDPNSNDSAHYIVDSDGTVYQMVHEKDVAFHAGNLWFNQHSIGIEHAGFAATGSQWYNATEYLASANLVAYLLNKYRIPLDHNHIVGHGTVPSPNLANTPNHVDPGPYWLWDYYLNLINTRLPYASKTTSVTTTTGTATPHLIGTNQQHPGWVIPPSPRLIALSPPSDQRPLGSNGTETTNNFSFFYLYTGPSTKSSRIPQEGSASDITDETSSVEPALSYYYINKVTDPGGTGDTLYEIWYGEATQAHASNPSFFAHGTLAWLAVPPSAATTTTATVVLLKSANGSAIQISGKPATNTSTNDYHIGDTPNGSIFASGYSVFEDGTHNLWYSIDYNHRQAWVPANNVVIQTS
jgi:N-acetyl-anhydromuramyl-L-alanine amidase AmpD